MFHVTFLYSSPFSDIWEMEDMIVYMPEKIFLNKGRYQNGRPIDEAFPFLYRKGP